MPVERNIKSAFSHIASMYKLFLKIIKAMCIIKIISQHPECFKLCHLPHCSIPQVTLLSFSYTVLQKCTLHTKHSRWTGRKHEVAHAPHLCPSGDAQRKGPHVGEVRRGSLRILGALIPKANPGLGVLNAPFSSGLGPPLGPWASPQLSWSQIPPIVPGGDGHGTVGASLGVDPAWASRPQDPLRSHHEDCLSRGCDWPQVNLTQKAMLCPGAQEVAPEPRLGGESIVDGEGQGRWVPWMKKALGRLEGGRVTVHPGEVLWIRTHRALSAKQGVRGHCRLGVGRRHNPGGPTRATAS